MRDEKKGGMKVWGVILFCALEYVFQRAIANNKVKFFGKNRCNFSIIYKRIDEVKKYSTPLVCGGAWFFCVITAGACFLIKLVRQRIHVMRKLLQFKS